MTDDAGTSVGDKEKDARSVSQDCNRMSGAGVRLLKNNIQGCNIDMLNYTITLQLCLIGMSCYSCCQVHVGNLASLEDFSG